MNAREIIAELPKLTQQELIQVQEKAKELASGPAREHQALSEALLQFAGSAEGLPSDLAENHDHYLHGVRKRNS